MSMSEKGSMVVSGVVDVLVGYQNGGQGSKVVHEFLEWGARAGASFLFIGEPWVDAGELDTQTHPG